ncbi:MAG: hypothetical protein WCS03_11650 [Bacteroidota bacterium]
MKRKPWLILLVTIGVFFTNSDCTKETQYLEKYVGSWTFEYIWLREELHIPAVGDTTYFEGDIIYGPCKRCITIKQLSKTFKVESDGQIINTCEPPSFPLHYQKYCKGYFEGDSIFHYETFERTPPNQIVTNITSLFGRKL